MWSTSWNRTVSHCWIGDALINNLEDGKSVKLGEFGTFRPIIKAKVANSEEAISNNNYRRRIMFTPGTALNQQWFIRQ